MRRVRSAAAAACWLLLCEAALLLLLFALELVEVVLGLGQEVVVELFMLLLLFGIEELELVKELLLMHELLELLLLISK